MDTLSRADHQATPQGRVSLGVGWRWRCCSSSAQWPRPMHRSAAVMAAGKITSNRHRNGLRHRRHRSCPRYGHGWKRARSYASRATISSDIRCKSAMLRVLQHQDRRPVATLSGSRRAGGLFDRTSCGRRGRARSGSWFGIAPNETKALPTALAISPPIESSAQAPSGGTAILTLIGKRRSASRAACSEALMKRPGDSRWDVDDGPEIPVPADRNR
jgi:hypothetical protein